MKRLHALVFLALLFVAACSGGGSTSNPDSPPPPAGTKLDVTLAATGSLPFDFQSTTPSGFRVMATKDEYIAFASGIGPPELRDIDYTQSSVLYLEGPLLDDLASVVRLVEVRRMDGTRDVVTGERCTPDVNAIPTPSRAYRSYAYYVVPKLLPPTTFAWVNAAPPSCATVSAAVNPTFIAEGKWNTVTGPPMPAFSFKVIRSQADLDALLPLFAPGAIPPQYMAPDFGQVTLLYLSQGIFDPNAYLRIGRVLVNDDDSRDVIAEFCGDFFPHVAFTGTAVLYAMPRFIDDARLTVIRHRAGSCFLSR
nr:hypothetical protein [uncultured bacterium]